jgi:uncharacterized protein (TIGR02466 family)
MQHVQVFPTVISVASFPSAEALNPGLERRIFELFERERLTKTQTTDRLHEDPAFTPLVEFFNAQIARRFADFKVAGARFEITSCWANIQRRGDALRYHSHANSFLSGSYYVRSPANCGALEFLDPRATGFRFDFEVTEMNQLNAEAFSVSPRPGMLVLFPSSIMHGTGRSDTDEPRISIAFNVMPRGELGSSRRFTRAAL